MLMQARHVSVLLHTTLHVVHVECTKSEVMQFTIREGAFISGQFIQSSLINGRNIIKT